MKKEKSRKISRAALAVMLVSVMLLTSVIISSASSSESNIYNGDVKGIILTASKGYSGTINIYLPINVKKATVKILYSADAMTLSEVAKTNSNYTFTKTQNNVDKTKYDGLKTFDFYGKTYRNEKKPIQQESFVFGCVDSNPFIGFDGYVTVSVVDAYDFDGKELVFDSVTVNLPDIDGYTSYDNSSNIKFASDKNLIFNSNIDCSVGETFPVTLTLPRNVKVAGFRIAYDPNYLTFDYSSYTLEQAEKNGVTSIKTSFNSASKGFIDVQYSLQEGEMHSCDVAAFFGNFTVVKSGGKIIADFYYAHDWNYKSVGADCLVLDTYDLSGLTQESNGLGCYDGMWFYFKDGVVDTNYTGLTKYYDTWYFVENGVLNWDSNPRLVNYFGTWYYTCNGVLDWDYTGLVKYYGTWYYVSNGVLNWDYTGLTNFYGTWYYVENSVLNFSSIPTLTNYYGTWYYTSNGVLNWNYSGKVSYDGIVYYVSNGVLA